MPSSTYQIDKDGNCLFSSLCALISGAQENSHALRQLICDPFSLSPLTSNHYSLFSNFPFCTSYLEYLCCSKMRQSGVWGGDLELSVFSWLFNFKIFVFIVSIDQWVVYSCPDEINAKSVFLLNWGSHWEPIASICFRSSTATLHISTVPLSGRQFTGEGSRKRVSTSLLECNVSKERKTNDKVHVEVAETLTSTSSFEHVNTGLFQSLIGHGVQHSNASVDFAKGVFTQKEREPESPACSKCHRVSTIWYPLQLETIPVHESVKRKFGDTISDSNCNVCEDCLNYIKSTDPKWKHAWPSVLYTLCFDIKQEETLLLFSKFPLQIKASWPSHAFSTATENDDLFQDITRDILEHEKLIKQYRVNDYKKAMLMYSLPSVECFCGASEFLDRAGCIPIHHLLNYLVKDFVAFRANWRLNLRCIRSDYLTYRDKNLVFKCRPSLVVSDVGLCLATCETHEKGSKDKVVHVPNHPVVGNLSHCYSDRLAPLVPSLRGVKPTKLGEFSHTFTMSKSVGGQSGVGCLAIHQNRNMAVKSDFLLPALEGTFLLNRLDSVETMTHVAEEFKLTKEDIDGFKGEAVITDERLENCLEAATYIPMDTIKRLKTESDKNTSQNESTLKHYIADCTGDNQLRVPLVQKKLQIHSYFISLVILLFKSIAELSNCIIENYSPVGVELKNLLCSRRPTQQDYDKFIEALGESTARSFSYNWRALGSTIDEIEVLTRFEDVSAWEPLPYQKVLLLLLERSSKRSDQIFSPPTGFQIKAIENNPCAKSYNVCLFRTLPTPTTVQLNMTSGATHAVKSIVYHMAPKKYRLVIYTKIPEIPTGLINLFSGQEKNKCPAHNLSLCCDCKDSGFKCVALKCKNLRKWRCPSKNCSISLCKKHYVDVDRTSVWPKIKAQINKNEIDSLPHLQSECSDTEETSEFDQLVDESMEDFMFLGPTCADNQYGLTNLDTDAGEQFLPIETNTNNDLEYLPIQLLFNIFLAVLNRPRSPVNSNLRFRRFMQCFTARFCKSSISLLQPEALIFPSIFYKQLDDGSSPGALPFFLYSSGKQCSSFGFASLLEHIRIRLTDISLLTSSNHSYIQFATDCLMNLQLSNSHSKVFFQRGIQSLKLYNQQSKLFNRCLTSITNDTEQCVRQLASAIASSPVTFFLTITCNQRQHPAFSQLWNAITHFYGNSSDEIRKSAFASYMSTMLRCWSRSVQYFFDLILNSSENILGKVHKIWGRAEFQSTTGNLPHYHILLWVEPGTYDIDDLIQCSEKNIFQSLNDLCETNLKLVTSENVFELFERMVKIHTHDCQKGGYRCQKRKDVEGNVICRTPAYPQSHHHWKLKIQQQYSPEALNLLEVLGLAEINMFRELEVAEPLRCEKYMYAASASEHILPTCSLLFALTESSVNLLRTTPRFSSSYLSSYAAKPEEHADGTIRSGTSGKSFRLRNDGIQNKSLATVKFSLQHEKDKNRKTEAVRCQLLAITESVFWSLGEPYVITNMNFKHIQNVPPEKRFVQSRDRPPFNTDGLSRLNFRNYVSNLPLWRKLTRNQQILVADIRESNETLDNMSQFSLRPPELLCIKSVKCYSQWFSVSRNEHSADRLVEIYSSGQPSPWISCRGSTVKVHPKALSALRNCLKSIIDNSEGYDVERAAFIDRCLNNNLEYHILETSTSKNLLPEIVFRSVPPCDTIDFLVSFLLRFGLFETELDLFSSTELLDSYKHARIIEDKQCFDISDVLKLLKKYVLEELIILPGGVLTFTAKLFSAKDAFSRLLKVENTETFSVPIVLISDMHNEIANEVQNYIKETQVGMSRRIRELGLPNLPSNPLENHNYWEPEVPLMQGQLVESFIEQQGVLRKIIGSIIEKFSSSRAVRHQIILGRPGTGKTHLSGVVLSHALCNGLLSYITSLPSRRAVQLYGEHIHRLFRISTKNLNAESLANEALVRLSHDHKRRTLLTRLQVLLVEEISLINAETWTAVDLIFRQLKDNSDSFGGVMVIANGDCCQLPNISGYNIFEACSFLFNFDFHFLQEFVRMVDPLGQELLCLLEKRPVENSDIERIIEIISAECNFVDDWQDIRDRMIMKVFGKRAAEIEAFEKHCAMIESRTLQFQYSKAEDQVSIEGSHSWRPCTRKATIHLNKNVNEYEKIIFYPSCVLRATQNLDHIQQGQLCVLDYNSVRANAIQVYVAPNLESVTEEALDNGDFLFWRKITLSKTPGYVQAFKRSSIRRTQFPVVNYVSLTVHRLMGDTFVKLATALSKNERKFALWLVSQFYVIVSRVKYLRQLFFVGLKPETLDAIRDILSKRSLAEERLFQFFLQLRQAATSQVRVPIEGPKYLRNHFDVPKTPNGYVYLMVSIRSMVFNIFYAGETDDSLSEALRTLNSINECISNEIRTNQPWAVGFFFWNFRNSRERQFVLLTLKNVIRTTDYSYEMLKNYCLFALRDLNHIKMCLCGRVVRREEPNQNEMNQES